MAEATVATSRVERELVWRERMERWTSGGQTAAEFAANEQVSVASLYQWRRRLQGGSSSESRPRFVPVRVAASNGVIEVVTDRGRVIRVGPDFDAVHLRAVLAALESPPC